MPTSVTRAFQGQQMAFVPGFCNLSAVTVNGAAVTYTNTAGIIRLAAPMNQGDALALTFESFRPADTGKNIGFGDGGGTGTPTTPQASTFSPVTVERSGAQKSTIPVPAGATKAMIETIGTGGNGFSSTSGSGGCYSKTNSASMVGISNLYIEISPAVPPGTPLPTVVKIENASGTILCSASSSGTSTPNNTGVGDIKFNGGAANSAYGGATGGGGAGRTGAGGGGNTNGTTAGAGNSPGGNGGVANGTAEQLNGRTYGGGGASQFSSADEDTGQTFYNTGAGGTGWVSITFT